MSDGVRELSTAQRNTMNTLQRKNKAELERVNRLNEKNIGAVRQAQEQEIHQLREQHQLELAQEVQNKEQKLQALRHSQEQTQRITEAETRRQQEHAVRLREDASSRAAADIQKTKINHEESVSELNQRFNDTNRAVIEEGRHKLHVQQDANRAQLRGEGEHWRQRIDQQRGRFQANFRSEGDKFEQMSQEQKVKNENESLNTHRAHQGKMEQMNKQHVKLSEQVTEQHQKSLVEKEQFFEKKYQTQLGQHLAAEKGLEERYQTVLARSKDDLTKRLQVEQNRASDPFFGFTELRPQIEEQPDRYIIKVAAPEYAKEEVTLTANHKELVLTSNRRYQDERKDEDGTQKKVNKVESMVSRIPVNQVLDPRKTSKEWSDGVVTFTVHKA